jgi:hypothetical protein
VKRPDQTTGRLGRDLIGKLLDDQLGELALRVRQDFRHDLSARASQTAELSACTLADNKNRIDDENPQENRRRP